MKSGKVIAVVLGFLALALIAFMLSNTEESSSIPTDRPTLEPNSNLNAQSEQKTIQKKGSDYQSDAELETVKKLRESVANVAEEEVSRTYYRSCAPCHGRDGKGIIAPSIAGKSKDEIRKSLKDYKANLVPNTLMKGLFENIDDATLEGLADEISHFKENNE